MYIFFQEILLNLLPEYESRQILFWKPIFRSVSTATDWRYVIIFLQLIVSAWSASQIINHFQPHAEHYFGLWHSNCQAIFRFEENAIVVSPEALEQSPLFFFQCLSGTLSECAVGKSLPPLFFSSTQLIERARTNQRNIIS